jgi:hypothetical protein
MLKGIFSCSNLGRSLCIFPRKEVLKDSFAMQQPERSLCTLPGQSRAYGIYLCHETGWGSHSVPFSGKEMLKGIFAMQQPGKVTLYLAWAKQGLRDIPVQ